MRPDTGAPIRSAPLGTRTTPTTSSRGSCCLGPGQCPHRRSRGARSRSFVGRHARGCCPRESRSAFSTAVWWAGSSRSSSSCSPNVLRIRRVANGTRGFRWLVGCVSCARVRMRTRRIWLVSGGCTRWSWGVGWAGGEPSRLPSPDFGADESGPGRDVSLGGDRCCAAAGLTGADGVWLDGALTGADGVLLGPGPALAGAVVRGVSGELACGALASGVRVGDSGLALCWPGRRTDCALHPRRGAPSACRLPWEPPVSSPPARAAEHRLRHLVRA